ncbi:MAG: GNAT family N-acetyltransferase [Dehalococcoidia bacterium]|nr:GNAT family N-acetyltransferase [Dehalococcoidia bacterium]
MQIKVRQARPEDAKLLGWCMLMAGRSHLDVGIWDFLISQPEERCLQFLEMLALEGPRHMAYYTEFMVAEVDGHPAAALEGFDPVTNGEETMTVPMASVMQKMGLTEQDMAPGIEKLAAFMTCHSDFLPDAWVVEQVATRPEYRRIGAISKLLEAVLDRGRQLGFKRAQVSFYIGNTPGERAYQKAGFKYLDEKRHPDFERVIGSPGMIRYVRDL